MKDSFRLHPKTRTVSVAAIAALLLAFPAAGQVVDPDPDLFDGTRTKPKDAIKQEPPPTLDKWEEANIIIYDSDAQGSQQGGQGRAGFENPGMDMGGQGGMGIAGLPFPIGGGGGGGQQQGGLEIPQLELPESAGGGMQGEMTDTPGGGPPPDGELTSLEKPTEMAIGDARQRIKATPAPIGDTSGLEKTAQTESGDGGDDTKMKAASGRQSGVRGSGVEKGDAIPTDL